MLPKKLDDLNQSDIETLVANAVREGRALDFKRDPVGKRDDDKREFLADITAFANTIGGDLVFGVDEAQGVAVATPGISLADPDEEILRLDQVIRSGIEPRLPQIDFKWIPSSNGLGYLIVRVGRSWAAPHRVTFRESKFYARSSAGKYSMDVSELRAAFLASQDVPERIRAFRRDRCATVGAGEGGMQTDDGPLLIVHLVPVSAFTNPLIVAASENSNFPPLGASGFNFSHSLEGHTTYSGAEDAEGSVRAYGLLFRDGRFEAVASIGSNSPERILSLSGIEQTMLKYVPHYVEGLFKLKLEMPFVLMISLINVRGCQPYVREYWSMSKPRPLRRDMLVLPETMFEEKPDSWESALKPTFDLMWNSFGVAGSPNYDQSGTYQHR